MQKNNNYSENSDYGLLLVPFLSPLLFYFKSMQSPKMSTFEQRHMAAYPLGLLGGLGGVLVLGVVRFHKSHFIHNFLYRNEEYGV